MCKDIVRNPEVCGKLTFPVSLKQCWAQTAKETRRCSDFVVGSGALGGEFLKKLDLIGKLVGNQFEGMKLEVASTKVQKAICKYLKWKAFTKLWISVLVLQTGLRAMDARKQIKYKK
ncbi:hypothetical protein AgCh_021251 [Apium graveolens]